MNIDESNSRAATDEVFAQLLTRHRSQLFRLIFCMVHRLQDTEDVFQQAAATMWDKFDSFEPGTDFGAWAAQVARNKALNFLSSRSRQRLCFSQELIGELARHEEPKCEVQDARLEALAICRQKLSAVDQELIAKCYDSKHSIKEVAGQIGRPVGSVYDSLTRIRRALFDCIQRKLADRGPA